MELLISALVGFVVIELYVWLPIASRWLLSFAVQRLPKEDRERCNEEWSAALEALPNTLAKLWHALSFIIAANTIKADAVDDASRLAMTELVSAQAASTERMLAMRRKLDGLPSAHQELRSSLGEQKILTLDSACLALDGAWSRAKQQFEVHAADNNRVTVTLEKASASFERLLESRRKPLQFWRRIADTRHAARDLMEARAALDHLMTNKDLDNALEAYSAAVEELGLALGIDRNQAGA